MCRITFFIFAFVLSVCDIKAETCRQFATKADAVKFYKQFETAESGKFASTSERGGGRYRETTVYETRWYLVSTGEYVGSDYFRSVYYHNTCGTIVVYPDSEFIPVESFEYHDVSSGAILRGRFVIVKIGVSSTASITVSAKKRAMKNLVESGANYKNKDGSSRRLVALNRSIRNRFRFSDLKAYYSSDRVGFVLFDYRPEYDDPSVSTMSFQR